MKIGLLALSGVVVRTAELVRLGVTLPGFVDRGRVVASLPSLALLILGALTPEDIDLEYVEVPSADGYEPDPGYDLVAISTYTAQAYDAYAIADRYRAAGVPVVLGGMHVSAVPEEAKAHADSVVIGEGETLWPRLIEDFRAGRMQPVYQEDARGGFDLSEAPLPRYDLLPDRGRYNRITVQTTRGCPHECEFCGGSRLLGPPFRRKPVARVRKEVETVLSLWDRPFIELADDNTFVDKRWSRELAEALAPLAIRYFTECDISVADDDELLGLLRDSGCYQLLIGFESVSRQSLAGLERRDWKLRQADRSIEAIQKIQSHGITVNGCFVLGLDGDTPAIFEETREFIERSGLIEAQLTVLTPLPGTTLLDRLRREGRLLSERFWDRCTLFDVTFRPKGMSVEELEQGLRSVMAAVYSEEATQRRKRRYIEIVKSLPERSPDAN